MIKKFSLSFLYVSCEKFLYTNIVLFSFTMSKLKQLLKQEELSKEETLELEILLSKRKCAMEILDAYSMHPFQKRQYREDENGIDQFINVIWKSHECTSQCKFMNIYDKGQVITELPSKYGIIEVNASGCVYVCLQSGNTHLCEEMCECSREYRVRFEINTVCELRKVSLKIRFVEMLSKHDTIYLAGPSLITDERRNPVCSDLNVTVDNFQPPEKAAKKTNETRDNSISLAATWKLEIQSVVCRFFYNIEWVSKLLQRCSTIEEKADRNLKKYIDSVNNEAEKTWPGTVKKRKKDTIAPSQENIRLSKQFRIQKCGRITLMSIHAKHVMPVYNECFPYIFEAKMPKKLVLTMIVETVFHLWQLISETNEYKDNSNSNNSAIVMGMLKLLKTGYSKAVGVDEKGIIYNDDNVISKRKADLNFVIRTVPIIPSVKELDTNYHTENDWLNCMAEGSVTNGLTTVQKCMNEIISTQKTYKNLVFFAYQVSTSHIYIKNCCFLS